MDEAQKYLTHLYRLLSNWQNALRRDNPDLEQIVHAIEDERQTLSMILTK